MVAVEGLYENGRIRLSETAPMETARVIVIFPGDRNEKSHISDQTARELFDEFTGSIQSLKKSLSFYIAPPSERRKKSFRRL